MSRRGWLKNLIHKSLIAMLFAAALYYINQEMSGNPELNELGWLRIIFWISLAFYFLLLLQFIRSSFFNHSLERFDPGSEDSLKRLGRMKRFLLTPAQNRAAKEMENPVYECINWLMSLGYEEAGRRTMGLVYEREKTLLPLQSSQKYERVFLIYQPMPNVLIVDRLLRECLAYIEQRKTSRPAAVNHLFLITDMDQYEEVTSAASGVVNFLLKIEGGSLCPWLLDISQGRLFYPLDRSLIKSSHRRRQNRLKKSFLSWLTGSKRREAQVLSPEYSNGRKNSQQEDTTVRSPRIRLDEEE